MEAALTQAAKVDCGRVRTPIQRQARRPALRAAAGAAAIPAFVAASVAGHDASAFGAGGGVRGYERQILLRIGLGGAKGHGLSHLVPRILRAQELPAKPAEDV